MNRIFFKCPVCGKTREVYCSSDTAFIGCYHDEDENGERIGQDHRFEIQCNKDKIESISNQLGFKWGCDEIIWDKIEDECYDNLYRSKNIFLENCTTINYEVYFNKVWIARMSYYLDDYGEVYDPALGRYNTIEEAKQACEEDFKERKASNE